MENTNSTYSVVSDQLRAFIERIEQLEVEKAGLQELIKEVMAEAKGSGYNTKTIRQIIRLRKQDPESRAEDEAVLEIYKAALGME